MTGRRRAAVLTAAYYAAVFGTLGAHLPYWPLWLDTWGLDAEEIGYFLGAATIARIAGTTLMPALGDRFAIRRWIIVAMSLATVVAHLAHLWAGSQTELLALTLMTAFVMAPPVPMGEALGLRAARDAEFAYAPIRAAGSVAFVIANVGIGAGLSVFGPDLVLWTVVAGFLVVAILGAVHPGGGGAAGSEQAPLGEIAGVLRQPVFLVFAIAVSTGQAAHMVYYAYSVLDWTAQGVPERVIGWLWAFGVLAEILLMLGPGRAWVARIGPSVGLVLAALAGLIRWVAMTAAPDVALLWPLQALHALTFALAHLAAMSFFAAAMPARMVGGVQGIKSGLLGGGLGALTLALAGGMVAEHGIPAAYWIAVGLSAVSLAFSVLLLRVWKGGRVV